MKSFLIITTVIGLVAADVSHLQGQSGYHYKVPQTSYGVPSHQINAQSHTASNSYKGYQQSLPTQQASAFSQQGFREPGYQQGGYQNSGYQSGSHYQTGSNADYHNHNNVGQYESSGSNVAQVPSSGYQYTGAQQGNQFQAANQYQSGSQYQTAVGQQHQAAGQQYQAAGQQYQAAGQQYQSAVVQKYQDYFRQQTQQPAQVFKHFYVHAAPEEPEQPKFRQPPVLPAPQKHYKIIFIKTPAQQAPEPQVVPIQQQNEEKTIVYVLVQKPEEARDIVVPKVEQKPPAKPEVFFIKYKGKEGSQAVINNIVNDYSKGEAGSVQYSGAENTGASAVSEASGAFAQSSVGQAESQYGLINQHGEEHSNDVHQSEYQVPQYFGSEAQGIKTASAEAVSGSYQKVAESSAVAQSAVSASESQSQESLNNISTSQGVPHESYGPPKFRAH